MPPEDRIAEVSPNWLLHFKCLATDPAVPWFLEVEGDPALQKQVISAHLDATAAAHRALADGAAKVAGIISGKSR
jgi:hypothetical protein